jgi:protein involved in polysaccharide export with SLBB domain
MKIAFAFMACLLGAAILGLLPLSSLAYAQSNQAISQGPAGIASSTSLTEQVEIATALPRQYAQASASTPRSVPTPSQSGDDTVAPDYLLSSNDKLKITVFGEDDLSGQFVVDASGNISMPLIGEVRAAGLSLRVLQRNIEGKLRGGYLVDPRVSAEMLNFRPFYVLGEVKNPGEYPYAAGLTLLNAVAQAGGFTPLANTAELGIRRDRALDEERIVVRAGQVILPGDTIRVDKAVVYILGEVDKPGEYPIPPGLNVLTAVAQAGGYTALADINNIMLKQAGMSNEISIPTSSAQLVKAGDTLRVEKSSFFILGEVTKPGEYPLLQALTVNNAAALAGGFTFRADVRRVFIRRAGEAEERSYKLDSNLRVEKGDTIRVPERFF